MKLTLHRGRRGGGRRRSRQARDGARGLRAILEDIMLDIMYELLPVRHQRVHHQPGCGRRAQTSHHPLQEEGRVRLMATVPDRRGSPRSERWLHQRGGGGLASGGARAGVTPAPATDRGRAWAAAGSLLSPARRARPTTSCTASRRGGTRSSRTRSLLRSGGRASCSAGRYEDARKDLQRLMNQYPDSDLVAAARLGTARGAVPGEEVRRGPRRVPALPGAAPPARASGRGPLLPGDGLLPRGGQPGPGPDATPRRRLEEFDAARPADARLAVRARTPGSGSRRRGSKLAEKELYVGRFYFDRGNYAAAVGRFTTCSPDYDAGRFRRPGPLLPRGSRSGGWSRRTQARAAFLRLVQEHSQSEWAPAAADRLGIALVRDGAPASPRAPGTWERIKTGLGDTWDELGDTVQELPDLPVRQAVQRRRAEDTPQHGARDQTGCSIQRGTAAFDAGDVCARRSGSCAQVARARRDLRQRLPHAGRDRQPRAAPSERAVELLPARPEREPAVRRGAAEPGHHAGRDGAPTTQAAAEMGASSRASRADAARPRSGRPRASWPTHTADLARKYHAAGHVRGGGRRVRQGARDCCPNFPDIHNSRARSSCRELRDYDGGQGLAGCARWSSTREYVEALREPRAARISGWGTLTEAVAAWERALELNPTHPLARIYLTQAAASRADGG
ncbi:MAG: tetratricopeptide repeat protein [Candidatus Moduliflexus flocculans]|nr:tetratricopeptide repeat protein [Candidatus Moduliflexus flocculans]